MIVYDRKKHTLIISSRKKKHNLIYGSDLIQTCKLKEQEIQPLKQEI